MSEQRTKVLYIAGNGRSGSTLLDSILGELPGFFAVGEVRQIWDEGMIENRLCGCGAPVLQCEVWREVLDHLAVQNSFDAQRIAGLREQLAQTKRLARILTVPGQYHRRTVPGLEEFLNATDKLYQSIQHVTKADVIVDSSKWPTYAFLLSLLQDVDLYVLHFVRDPRACAFSWTRGKELEPGRPMDIQTPFYSTMYWVVWNPVIRHLWRRQGARYCFLRYEDFIANPRSTIENIVKFVGSDVKQLPFSDDRTVTTAKTHAISGNPTKFVKGPIRLKLDDEWKRRMPARQRALVTAMTWPFLWRYGYLANNSSSDQ